MNTTTTRRRLCTALVWSAAVAVPVLAVATSSLDAVAASTQKAALVVGNADYSVGILKNPVNDARSVAASLRALGFDVTQRENMTLRDMIETFRRFSMQTRNASVRVVFYAGHGVQVQGRNYLLPVNTEIRTKDEMPSKSADLNEFLERLAANKRGTNVVILDACRNNPFSGSVIVGPDGRKLKLRGVTPVGLAPIEASNGSMIAYSTAPGGVALDNPSGKNSLYTKYLLKYIQVPGLPVEMLFKRVRHAVARDTGHVQVPWENSGLINDFCFRTVANGGCNTH